ncbi:tetratricopeptide repeat-containing sulfotransferase family protein [Thiobacillus sedimenti]|uniref:Sulfotransferase n=1 Tax=Thiobacillus sedimenti TaxID=3110231 RepID=A0ABZ1CLE7_9PROT|nr:sulfotransferase [Thiobacillus sp. SCUT-2]WRS39775.1 sulfotransferase [Thiobacillus sp. SCUT-2]
MPTTSPDGLQSALAHARAGNLANAERICTQLLAQPDPQADAFHLLGVIRNIQGRYSEAEPLLGQAIAQQPGIAKYHSNLANALRGLERPEEAEASYRKALALDPDFDDARVNLARLLHAMNRWDAAVAEYEHLVRRHPHDTAARVHLAHLLQSGNRLAEAEAVASAGLLTDPANPGLNLIMAICERRAQQFEQALQRFQHIDASGLDSELASVFHYERGLLYDRLDLVAPAFADFAEANRLQAGLAQQRGIDKVRYTDELDRLARIDVSWLRDLPATASQPPAPVFLIGFPRSGTTLLDQILDSHPQIQTLEEKPIVGLLCDDMDRLVAGRPNGLADLRADERARLRALYHEYVADFLELRPGTLLVDKYPLNLIRLPYILSIFPDARLILALRHPADCVLSGFMHLFAPNDAMANFYTLDDAAALYARVMGLWRRWAEQLPLRYHRVYYEHLVQDLPGEIQPLLDFLGQNWNADMARPHEHAARRGHINTPSHSQVTQPIYRRAAGRWQRYQPWLDNVMETLQPYVDHFGYRDQGEAGG